MSPRLTESEAIQHAREQDKRRAAGKRRKAPVQQARAEAERPAWMGDRSLLLPKAPPGRGR